MRESELVSKVYTKFHKALVQLESNDIVISFSQMKLKLGLIFRIHSNERRLNEIQHLNWLDDLKEYCTVSSIKSIPDKVKYRIISNKPLKMSNAKLNRLIKRGSISSDDIKSYKIKMLSQGFDNPYLDLFSSSNGVIYRKFFDFSELLDKSNSGQFDTFGLSKQATIPWF